MRRLLDRPAATAAIALVAALVFVAARLVFGTDGDVTRFIVAGASNLAGHGLPAGIHVSVGTGYDGQFYFRQALSPFEVSTVAHGIRLDGEYRLQRLGYPLLAYAASLGRPGLVPDALVGVNIAGAGMIGLFGGLIARDAGRHACWGLLLAVYFGLVTTLARDLTEIVEVSLLLAAIVAYRRGRYLLAGLAFAGAVVTKETEVFVVAAFGVVLIWRAIGGLVGKLKGPPLSAHATYLVPAAAFAGVQGWLYAATGHLAGTSGAQGNFATPLTAPVHAVALYLRHPATLADAIWLAELAVLAIVVLAAMSVWRESSAAAEERLALVFLIGLSLSLSGEVWNGQADFRSLAPLYELAVIVLLGSRKQVAPAVATVASAGAYLVTFVHRVRFT